ncbi:MAG: hypothetical protein WC661_16245 [Opitutaceae bacterium]|jgi:hypothetical protein
MKLSLFSRAFTYYTASCCIAGLAYAEAITLQDDFDRKGKEMAGLLHGQPVGSSKTLWEATSNVIISPGAGIKVDDQGAFVGRVALPAKLSEVTVEVDIHPAPPTNKTAGSPPWIAAGIGNGPLSNPNFGGLFLLVYPNGIFSLLFNPSTEDERSSKVITLKSGRIQSWNPDAMNRLKIVYNQETGSVSAYINNDEEMVAALSLKTKGLSLTCGYAGFSGFGQSSEARSVGNFSLKTTE